MEKKSEFNGVVLQLLKEIEKENPKFKEFLIKKYKGLPCYPKLEEAVYNYGITHSKIFAVTTSNPGTSLLTEFLYEGKPQSFPLDRYFLNCKGGKAIKSRLITIEKKLPFIIEEYLKKKKKIVIGNLGSGPGRDIIDVLAKYYRNTDKIKAINIDRDKTSLDRGKRLAQIKGVAHLIEFVHANFLRYKPKEKFDIALLIGVLCPLNVPTCIKYLKRIKKLLKRGGCVIVSNTTRRMLEEDPFTCFLMKWGANWELVYKDEKDLKYIFEKAGYKWKEHFYEPYRFHIMGVGCTK